MKVGKLQQPTLQSRRGRWLKWSVNLASVGLLVLVCVYFTAGAIVRQSSAETIKQAEKSLFAKDTKAVRKTLEWLLWFEPDHHEALLLWGVSLHLERRYVEAIDFLGRIPEGSENFEEAATALAATLVLDYQLERAENFLKRVVQLFPHSTVVRENLSYLYKQEMRKRDAIDLLMDRWRADPDDLSVLPALLELETTSLTPQGPEIYLKKVNKRYPNQAPVVLALAYADQLLGKNDLARVRFRAALVLRPQHAETRILAAGFFLEIGDLDAAGRLLLTEETAGSAESFELYSEDDRFWSLRCRLAQRLGDIEAAAAHLEKALALRPKEREYLSLNVGLLRRRGRLDEAANVARELSSLARDWNRILFVGGELEFARPKEEECSELAELLFRAGRPKQAAGWRIMSRQVKYGKAMELFPPTSQSRRESMGVTTP